jgi:hypothetical protein
MKLLFALFLLGAVAVAATQSVPDTNCAGTASSPPADTTTGSVAPPSLYWADSYSPVTVYPPGSASGAISAQSDVDSSNTRIVFSGSNIYNSVKFELIDVNSTWTLQQTSTTTKPCNGYFNTPAPNGNGNQWVQMNAYCGYIGYPWYNAGYCGCSYTPYFVFTYSTDQALTLCFYRTEGVETVAQNGNQAATQYSFYYFDTVVQSTYTVNRPLIRNKPVLRTVITQTHIQYKFQKVLTLTTANNGKGIYVGGLRQVYADITQLFYNPINGQVYVEIFTSVQWPYQLFPGTQSGISLDVVVDPAPVAQTGTPGFTVVGSGLQLIPNTTSGYQCGALYEGLCEQLWSFNLSMPSWSAVAGSTNPNFYCNMQPNVNVYYDVGCQQLYLDEGANCTVGSETKYVNFAFQSLPVEDFCLKVVETVTYTGTLLPYPSLNLANAGSTSAAVYSYVYGGPIYFRGTLTPHSTTGYVPTFSRILLTAIRVISGNGALYNFNMTANAEANNDFLYFNSGTVGQNFVVFTFAMNERTVTLANYDQNQLVTVEADMEVAFQNINSGFSKGMHLMAGEDSVSFTSVSGQFIVGTSAAQDAGASSSSVNVVAVAAGSSAGVVALAVLIAFVVHRRATKKVVSKSTAAASAAAKEFEEEAYDTHNSFGSGSSV